jgi:hypothetical protein
VLDREVQAVVTKHSKKSKPTTFGLAALAEEVNHSQRAYYTSVSVSLAFVSSIAHALGSALPQSYLPRHTPVPAGVLSASPAVRVASNSRRKA